MENHIVWMELTVSAPRPVLLAVASLVIEWGARGIVEGTGEVVAYFTPEVREEIEIRLRRFAMDLGDPIRWVWHADVGEVWRDAWKSHFHASRVSDRLGVCPSWERWNLDAPEVRVIRIDPGQAFGTGTHETTRLCLRLIDEALAQEPAPSFLDAGCGSGILSIAARFLGVPRVTAIDIDPLATSAALTNARANGVDSGLLVVQGDLRAVRPSYPLVAANVLFQILLGLAPLLSARVTPGGRLILSGMLTEELSPAEAVFGRLGMVATRIRSEGEWGALLLVRAPVAPGQAG